MDVERQVGIKRPELVLVRKPNSRPVDVNRAKETTILPVLATKVSQSLRLNREFGREGRYLADVPA